MSSRTNRLSIWIASIGSIGVVTAVGSAIGLNPSTIGFAYLIVVLLISLWGGLLVGTVASVVATLCYNFFFFPPLYTFRIENPANWFALVAFLVASVTATAARTRSARPTPPPGSAEDGKISLRSQRCASLKRRASRATWPYRSHVT